MNNLELMKKRELIQKELDENKESYQKQRKSALDPILNSYFLALVPVNHLLVFEYSSWSEELKIKFNNEEKTLLTITFDPEGKTLDKQIELGYYSSSANNDFEFLRLSLIGNVAKFILEKRQEIVNKINSTSNLIYSKFDVLEESLETKIRELNSLIEAEKLTELDSLYSHCLTNTLSSPNEFFIYVDRKNKYKTNSLKILKETNTFVWIASTRELKIRKEFIKKTLREFQAQNSQFCTDLHILRQNKNNLKMKLESI